MLQACHAAQRLAAARPPVLAVPVLAAARPSVRRPRAAAAAAAAAPAAAPGSAPAPPLGLVMALGADAAVNAAVEAALRAAGFGGRSFLLTSLDEAKAELSRVPYDLVILGGAAPKYPDDVAAVRAFVAAHSPATRIHQLSPGDVVAGTVEPGSPPLVAAPVTTVAVARRLLLC